MENFAFVDGSFNKDTKVYGYGGFLNVAGEKIVLQGHGDVKEFAESRNVAGEVFGSMAAIQKAIELGVEELKIYYDYEGIEKWASGEWKANKDLTKFYSGYIATAKNVIKIEFEHVKAHTGIDGNEEADRLAKEAVGL